MEPSEKLPQLFFNGDATFSIPCPLTDLKKLAPKWSLAGDAQLLGFMQNLSHKLISQTKDIQKQLNNLTYNAKMMDVKLNNTFNDFNALANTQFVENRVYDEDPCIPQQQIEEKPRKAEGSTAERDAEMMMMMNEAVRLCREALVCPSDPARKGHYARTLPPLLNRQQKTLVEDRSRNKKANRIESSSNDPPAFEEADKLSQMSDAGEARRPSSSLESSLKAESLQGRKESTRDLFADDDEEDDGNLFSRTIKVPKTVAAVNVDRLVSSSSATSKDKTFANKEIVSSSTSSLASDRPAKENKGKVKSLFDESDGDGEDDIFQQISKVVVERQTTAERSKAEDERVPPSAKKVPVGAVSVFGNSFEGHRPSLVQSQKPLSNDDEGSDKPVIRPSSSSSSLDSKTKQRRLATKKPLGLFDDDDDGDLFSSANEKPDESKPPERPSERKAAAETQNEHVLKIQKPVPVKSLFDDDDDDDIFSKLAKQSMKASKTRAEVAKVKQTKDEETKPSNVAPPLLTSTRNSDAPRKKSIFDDDDDDVVGDDAPLSVNRTERTTNEEIQKSTAAKIKSIFDEEEEDDDDDDDDGADLFGDLLKSTKKTTSEATVKLKSESTADAMGSKPPQVLPSVEKKNSVLGIPQVLKVKKSLFDDDDDEDEDDLFSNLLKNKSLAIEKKVIEPPPPQQQQQQQQGINKLQEGQKTTTTTTTNESIQQQQQQQQQQPTTVDQQNDSKESKFKTSFSPEKVKVKVKVKGDTISKLQTSLNIDPLSLGPFSHKKFQKEDAKADGGVENESDPRVFEGVATGKSDLDVGKTRTLPSLVKGRPKVTGRRRPATRNQSIEVEKNSSQSNANVLSTETKVFQNDFVEGTSSVRPLDGLRTEEGTVDGGPFSGPAETRAEFPSVRLLPKQEDVRNFFDASSFDRREEAERKPPEFASNDLEPPPLFSDDDDDDEDLFGNFQKRKDSPKKDVSMPKQETTRTKEESFTDENAKTDFGKSKTTPAFDDDDDDDEEDLFAALKLPSGPTPKHVAPVVVATPVKTSSALLFNEDDDDDDDLFADVSLVRKDPPKSDLPPPRSTDVPKNTFVPTAPSNPSTGKSLFQEEEDEDEDLFSEKFITNTLKNNKGPTKAVAKHGNLFEDSDDDIFNSLSNHGSSSKGASEPPSVAAVKVGGKSLNLFGDPLSNL